jgi:hypothetical protein
MMFEANPAQLSPPLYSIWYRCWIDAISSIVWMSTVALVAFVLLIPLEAVNSTLVLGGEAKVAVARVAIVTVQAFLLAPLLIAVHRYVLLGEVTRHYSLRPFSRYLRFAGYAVIFEVVAEIATQCIARSVGSFWLLAIQTIAVVVLLYVGLRMLILFPAIAIDAAGIPWRQAWRETQGHSLALLFTALLASLPLVLVNSLYGLVAIRSPNPEAAVPVWVDAIIWAAVAVLFGALYAAMASRLYRAFGVMNP